MLIRLVLTVIVLGIARGAASFAMPIAAMGASRMAGLQMTNSDQDAVSAVVGMNFFSGIGAAITTITALLLLLIWRKQIRQGWTALRAAIAAAAVVVALMPGTAGAFYSATDVTEAYGILPNHTAFWVPGTGDAKNNQAHMESEEFLKANKVPGKFFVIPHVKLSGNWPLDVQ